MAKLSFVGTYGSENPTMACFTFLQAKNAGEAGVEAEITLIGDAVGLMRKSVRDSMFPVGWPPLSELFDSVVEHKIPIYV